jgi:hypothetical protein
MKYLIHLAVFYCGLVLSYLAQLLLVLIIPPLGKVTNPLGRAMSEPVFPLLILAGFAAGRYCYQRIPSRLTFAIWIVPGIFLLYSAWSWHKTMSGYDSVWDTYFGSGCGGSECLYELVLTDPFYSAIAYSLGALISTVLMHKNAALRSPTEP